VRRTTVLVSVTVALVLAGCGGGADQTAQVRAAVLAYGNAVAAKDYATICDKLFAPNLLQQMSSIALPCKTALARGFGSVVKPTMVVKSVQVTGQSALVSVHTAAANEKPEDTTIGLVEVGSSWRIASLTGPATKSK
jgi:hypothetical protein